MLTKLIIAVLIVGLIILIAVAKYKPSKPKPQKSYAEKLADSLEINRKVDSITKSIYRNALMDTVGVAAGPVKVISATIVREEYSNYRSIRLGFKNVSGKKIAAIKFKWYGLNAFGDPADMGGVVDGYSGGYTDDALGAGKTDYGTWSILSRDVKKIVIAWPYEVAFADGTSWKSTRE